MGVVKQTDHVGQGQERVITPLLEKEKFQALLASYLAEVQAVEDALIQVLEERWPDVADSTAVLDLLGRVVGQPRNGLTNAQYSLWIQARIKVNRASGTPAELLEIAALLSGATVGTIELGESFPAQFTIDLGEILTGLDGEQISDIIREAKPAGVGFYLTYFVDEDSLTFSDTDDTKTDADKGWGDDTITTVGGVFSSAT